MITSDFEVYLARRKSKNDFRSFNTELSQSESSAAFELPLQMPDSSGSSDKTTETIQLDLTEGKSEQHKEPRILP